MLVHAAGSGVGNALIQICKLSNVIVICTAGTTEKLEKAKNLGADVCINYKNEDFSDVILSHTAGQGVDIIFDCIGEGHSDKNIKSIGIDGKWVVYGTLSGPNTSIVKILIFLQQFYLLIFLNLLLGIFSVNLIKKNICFRFFFKIILFSVPQNNNT